MAKKSLIVVIAALALLLSVTSVFAQLGTGWYDIYSDVRMRGQASVWGDLDVGEDLLVRGSLDVAEDLDVSGSLTVSEGLSLGEALEASQIDVAGFLTSYGPPIEVITGTKTITPTGETLYLMASGDSAITVEVVEADMENGMVLTFLSLEALAHVVKIGGDADGFNVGGGAADNCILDNDIGSNVQTVFYEGQWYILNSVGCTLD